MQTAIILWGVSGSGKTTVGKALAARLGWVFMDIDDYFWSRRGRPEKMPSIILSGEISLSESARVVIGSHISGVIPSHVPLAERAFTNWDSEDSIDWAGFENDLLRSGANVIIAGFCIPPDILQVQVAAVVELRISEDPAVMEREVLAARFLAKPTGDGWAKHLFMVLCVVIPSYIKRREVVRVTKVVPVTRGETRIPVEDVVNRILDVLI